MVALWLSAPAWAGTWKICGDITTTWAGVPHANLWQDYLSDNGPHPMRGVRIKVKKNGGSWLTPQFANSSAPDVGCASFNITTSGNHTIRVESVAESDGHTINAWQSDTNQTPVVADLTTTWNLPSGGGSGTKNVSLDVAATGNNNEWNLLTAAAWALHHRDGGLNDMTWTLYDQICPGHDDGPCYYSDDDTLYQPSSTLAVDLHELGHYIFHRYVESGSNNDPVSPHTDDCFNQQVDPEPGHALQNKEWQAEAFHEGFANFYAIVSVNSESDTDCSWGYYAPVDFDLDGDNDSQQINCRKNPMKRPNAMWIEVGDTTQNTAIDDLDYFGDIQDELGCSTESMVNHVTEFDYVRFFWVLYEDPALGLSFGDILEIIDGASPEDWDGSTTTPAYLQSPGVRLLTSAYNYDLDHGTSIYNTFVSLQISHGLAR